jgi:hypothetical protein
MYVTNKNLRFCHFPVKFAINTHSNPHLLDRNWHYRTGRCFREGKIRVMASSPCPHLAFLEVLVFKALCHLSHTLSFLGLEVITMLEEHQKLLKFLCLFQYQFTGYFPCGSLT